MFRNFTIPLDGYLLMTEELTCCLIFFINQALLLFKSGIPSYLANRPSITWHVLSSQSLITLAIADWIAIVIGDWGLLSN